MAECDSETLCEVVFTLSPLEMARNITPGEPIDVLLPLTDLVEVDFTSRDAAQPPNQEICIVDKDKIRCSPDYKERSSLLNTLQIKDGSVSDSGIYTVRDKVNDEIIVNLQINVKEEKTCPVCNQERSRPVWESVLVAVLVIWFILSVLLIVYLWKKNSKAP
ncbi:uncharacterized protein Hap1MRO34_023148 [Clarias gariepinus]